jgi:hypothetical protein
MAALASLGPVHYLSLALAPLKVPQRKMVISTVLSSPLSENSSPHLGR